MNVGDNYNRPKVSLPFEKRVGKGLGRLESRYENAKRYLTLWQHKVYTRLQETIRRAPPLLIFEEIKSGG